MTTFRRLRSQELCLFGACALVSLISATGSRADAAEPVPPVMETLLKVFPERNGWFVEEPLGAPSQTPEKARHFFETFRIVAPDVGALDLAVGRLLSAADALPIKKITRYDRKPNAPGLPGFRGIWCRTENKEIGGVSIVTPSQNRFLIWASRQYYPAWGNDSIKVKVRDWYARSVGQYFASLEAGVPGTEPPRASSRSLPEWMDLYAVLPPRRIAAEELQQLHRGHAEIRTWGLEEILSFQPTSVAIDRYAVEAPDTLWINREARALQHTCRDLREIGLRPVDINALTPAAMDTLSPGAYAFAADQFGRIRILSLGDDKWADADFPQDFLLTHGSYAVLFPGAPLLSAGTLQIEDSGHGHRRFTVSADGGPYLNSTYADDPESDFAARSNLFIESLGHFFAALKDMGVPLDGMAIRKFRDVQ